MPLGNLIRATDPSCTLPITSSLFVHIARPRYRPNMAHARNPFIDKALRQHLFVFSMAWGLLIRRAGSLCGL